MPLGQIPELPQHIKTCPSVVELEQYAQQFEQIPAEQKKRVIQLARQLTTAIRRSELKNNRCLVQAIAYYEKIRSQRKAP